MITNNSDPEIVEKQNKKLSILYEVALTVGMSLDLKTVLDNVLEKIIAFMAVDAGVIYVIDEETLEMIPVSFKNLSPEVVKDLCENRVKVGECMCGSIAQCDREVIIHEKASQDPRFTRGVLKKEGMEFYAGLPLKAKGKVVGVLCVITHDRYDADAELLDILRAATQPIGLAIENGRIFENTRKKAETKDTFNFEGIITNSEKMLSILTLVRKVTDVTSSVLLYGESGTGKELIARAIHYNSMRRDRPFIAVNCAAIHENLLESELFGYLKGAFTGAYSDKQGLLQAADGGTIFLDEVDSMSTNLQAKLLRFLQDRTFVKVGDTRPVTVDVRIIAASNRRLEDAIAAKQFRDDLYYRLNVIRIDLPALRERSEDIPLLARYFMGKFSRKLGRNIRRISDDAMNALVNYSWPGNIRELENSLERAVVVAETDEILKEDIPAVISDSMDSNPDGQDWTLEKFEQEHINKVLKLAGGNKKKAAILLGLNVSTLWRKLKS